MSLFGKVKNLFRGQTITDPRKLLPSIVQTNVNPRDIWDIVGELGDGAFGKVEKAVSKSNRSYVAAAKVIEIQDGEEIQDFLIEIEILNACKHENIVGLYASYYFEDKLHMLLEFCGGGAVDNIMIELQKPLTEKQIAYIAKYTCEAIRFLHENNVIHRDLKAGNILLTNDATVKLADFGVSAKLRDRNEKRATFIGTPYWMAPEVMVCETFKDKPYDCISDIWSFGITLIEMAQLEPPHSDISPMRVLIKVQKSDPPTLDNPHNWSIFFADFLAQCLIKKPEERRTAAQLTTHPFIKDAVDRKSVLALLAEVNAEIEEEVIIEDDRGSCDESCADSEEQTSEEPSWATPSPAPIPHFKEPAMPVEQPKKRAAPPPPVPNNVQIPPSSPARLPPSSPARLSQERENRLSKQMSVESHGSRTSKISQVEISYGSDGPRTPKSRNGSSQQLSVEPVERNQSRTPDNIMSPGRQAMNILDDLNSALDDGNGSPIHRRADSSNSLTSAKSLQAVSSPHSSGSPASLHKGTEIRISQSPLPEKKIKQILDAARSISKSPSPSLSRGSLQSLNSLHEAHHASVTKEVAFQAKEAHHAVRDRDNKPIRMRLDVKDEKAKSSGVGDLRDRFETETYSRPTSQSEDQIRENVDVPQGHVKSKIRQVIEEANVNVSSAFEAKKIANDRRQADAVLMVNQPAVSKIAATFTVPTVPPPKSVNNNTPKQLSEERTTREQSTPAVLHSPVPVKIKQPSASPVSQKVQHSPATPSSNRTSQDYNYFDTPASSSSEASFVAPEPPKPKKEAPPPEPPVDYDEKQNSKENAPPIANGVAADDVRHRMKEPGEPRIGARKNPNRQTVTKKTRTYMIDGMQVTSTTLHVLGAKEDMQSRKQQLQDLRRLQREEARQKQELQAEGANLAEQQERKFQQEKMNLAKQYDLDMEALDRKQKREIEDSERSQEEELSRAHKRLKMEQEKDLRAFRERMKQEMKIMKQELDMLPRTQRKDAMKLRKDQLEHENNIKEADFMMQLQKNSEATLTRMAMKHKEKIAQQERQALMQKHLLLRAKENSDWELEEKQMGEKYVLHRKLFKDEYFLLRTQMVGRHQKEVYQATKNHQEEEEELVRALALDRKKLPKMLRQEAKTRSVMFKESLRISMQPMSSIEMGEKMRRFDEQESLRIRNALEDHDHKSSKKVAALKEKHQAAMAELEEMQNEKRKQLLEKERNTMQEHENKYFEMRNQWQADLAPRKMALESRFQDELEAQERFYGIALGGGTLNSTTPILPPRLLP